MPDASARSTPRKRAAPSKPVAPKPRDAWAVRGRWIALAVVAGVLWFLGCPPWNLWPLSWIAMVPTLYGIDRSASRRGAFFYAWLTGTVGNAGGFYWIAQLLTSFAGMPLIAGLGVLLLFAAYQGLIFALFGLAVHSIRRAEPRVPMALVAPVAMVTFELVVPVIFPFHVAITQAWVRPVIQIADITGALGVTGLLLMVNGAVYDLATARKARWRSSAIAGGVLATVLAYGFVRIGQIEHAQRAAPHVTVGLVQPNVPMGRKGVDYVDYAAQQLADLQRESARLEAQGAELIVWPESAYPYALPHAIAHEPRSLRYHVHAGFEAPVIFGALTHDPPGGARYPYNTALMLDRDGEVTAHFDKMFLLLFGETFPGRDTFPSIARMLPPTSGQFTRGAGAVAMPFTARDGHTYRLGPMICYEDILPEYGRRLAPLRPDLLVNITNDAWFGDTAEPWEHLELALFRAIESRTSLVRAVNTGVTAFVDATGHVYARTYATDPAVHPHPVDGLAAPVAMLEGGHTVYDAVGELFGWLCALATAFGWWVWPRMLRRRNAGAP